MLSSAKGLLEKIWNGTEDVPAKPTHRVVIYGGGTITHVRNHLALCAPAYGAFAKILEGVFNQDRSYEVDLRLTRMAGGESIETNAQLADDVYELLRLDPPDVVVMNAAVCDYDGSIDGQPSGKYETRLRSRDGDQVMQMYPAGKIVPLIKQYAPETVVVAFKTTCDADRTLQRDTVMDAYAAGHADIIVGNDTVTRLNMVSDGTGLVTTRSRRALAHAINQFTSALLEEKKNAKSH